MDWMFAAITLLIAFSALGSWRIALFACVILDIARDVVRKSVPGYPVIPTVIVGVVWAFALLGAASSERRELNRISSRYPTFVMSMQTMVAAVFPGALIALIRYENGWMLCAIGGISYLAPFIGVVLGYLWPRRSSDVLRWLSLYVVLNSIVLSGAFLEAYDIDVPGLGGMKMDWIRNFGEDTVKLISGFYRSPDVMGLHAAHVIMFSVIIASQPSTRWKWFWIMAACWASGSLLLCGRRKMIVMPVLFFGTFVVLHWMSGRFGRRVALVSCAFGAAVAAGLFAISQVQEEGDEYSRFASSIVTEGVERASKSFTSIIDVTVRQSGWLGDGLGAATQGKQYTGVTVQKSWQEDGVGRLFKELGIPGVVLVLVALGMLARAVRDAIAAIPLSAGAARQLQFGILGVVAANAGSFIVSHQAYSGDPSTVLIVGFCLGIALGMPRVAFSRP
ncbi:MAG: hypothetical protein JSS49_01765 [Planctomycetes bacterium]|nr:hypothetical protein [Planctomycetota bacterium]